MKLSMWSLVQDRLSSHSPRGDHLQGRNHHLSLLQVFHFVTSHSDSWCGQSIFQMNKLRLGAVKWFVESARSRRLGSDLGLSFDPGARRTAV